jgi:hypothetical protein
MQSVAANRLKDPNWAFSCIVKFLQFQRERVEREEITGETQDTGQL